MKNIILILLTIHCSLFTFHLISQPCLPEGIQFYTQEEIDNFQINHPNCTEIEGDIIVGYLNSNITNLNGLNVVTSIGGNLNIHSTSSLTSLAGLGNLSYIEGDLRIYGNAELTSLSGLESLSIIGGKIEIGDNHSLTSIAGLANLTTIVGDLNFYGNSALTSLTGLENLNSVGSELKINHNSSLTNLDGLQSLPSDSISNLTILQNSSLATCEVECICNYLANPNGIVTIYNNAIGCNNPTEVANAGGITLSCLPYGNYYLLTQSEIDDFQINYPNCTELEGDVYIGYLPYTTDITNLIGLSEITSIGGGLSILKNDYLTNLTGLDNLTSIIGSLRIISNDSLAELTGLNKLTSIDGNLYINDNNALINLTGLDSLTYIEGRLIIGGYDGPGNASLINLTGLNNLTYIGNTIRINENESLENLQGLEMLPSIVGGLTIRANPSLSSLTGLNNVNYIGGLSIQLNSTLSSLSVLEKLDSIGGDLYIWNNELTSLTGLENLTTIGGSLVIWGSTLDNLTPLENLVSIEGDINIGSLSYGSTALTNLTGLNNVNAGSIENISIIHNPFLSSCAVQSICDYLASPNGTIEIHDNASGCNNPEEVEDACWTSVDELGFDNEFIISPNPTKSITTITYTLNQSSSVTIKILDLSGRQMLTTISEFHEQGEQRVTFNTKGLKSGIYFCILKTNEKIQTLKLIKH